MKKSRDQLVAAIILVFVLMGIGSLVSENTPESYHAENTAGYEIEISEGYGRSTSLASAQEL